jgi:diguanylate cyclase (GGDEF)-like protein
VIDRGLVAFAAGLVALVAGVAAALTGTAVVAAGVGVVGFALGLVAWHQARAPREGASPVVSAPGRVPESRDEDAEQAAVFSEAMSDGDSGADEGTEARLRGTVESAEVPKAMAAGAGKPRERDPDALDSLTDDETGLFSEAYFAVALDARIASARRHLRPVAVVLIDVQAKSGPTDSRRVAEVIRETVREADTACRLGDGSYALLLEDTPENGAIWTVERLRRAMSERDPAFTLRAGVSCYPAHGFDPMTLRHAAELALGQAQEWQQDRIEVATAE